MQKVSGPGTKEWRTAFTTAEMKELLVPSNARGFLAVATTWLLICGSFYAIGTYPGFVSFALGLFILGGRHLALAILMHEASHFSLFKSRKANDWIGQWLCAYPTWQDLKRYRAHHMKHHQYTGQVRDPDLSLVEPFPISRRSFGRKFFRDVIGLSGLKRIYGLLLMDFGFIQYTASAEIKKLPWREKSLGQILLFGIKNMSGMVITNSIIWGLLAFWGKGWVYGFWLLAYLSPFSVFVRIRSIAEHACTPDALHPLLNTRSTRAHLLARLSVAPHNVNYHLEHHLFMQAPYFQLPKIHKRLKEKGVLADACTAQGYGEVMALATTGLDS